MITITPRRLAAIADILARYANNEELQLDLMGNQVMAICQAREFVGQHATRFVDIDKYVVPS